MNGIEDNMGTDIYSRAFIGVKVHESKLWTVKTFRAYHHNYPDHYKVDPITGNPLWKTEKVRAPGVSDDRNFNLHVAGWSVHELDNENSEYVIALRSVGTVSSRSCPSTGFASGLPDSKDLEDFKSKLQESGFWDEKSFGLWVMTEFS